MHTKLQDDILKLLATTYNLVKDLLSSHHDNKEHDEYIDSVVTAAGTLQRANGVHEVRCCLETVREAWQRAEVTKKDEWDKRLYRQGLRDVLEAAKQVGLIEDAKIDEIVFTGSLAEEQGGGSGG